MSDLRRRLTRSLLVLSALAIFCGACATENGAYIATNRGELLYVPAVQPHQDELARCEATGMSHQQCCDNHQIDPCP